ncbi:PxKF domain-containing protein [Lysobacter tyrosinilyticus]
MSNRLGRALRGLFFACLGLATLPAMAQLRQEGAIPDGRGGVGVLATGIHHTCGLRQDGKASCWGDNYDGEAKPLPGTFIELSAGFQHTCGLRGDGSVECWGQGYSLPPGAPPPPPGMPPKPSPIPTGTYTALASGMSTTCGLRVREQPWQNPEGNVVCWSANGWNQLPSPPPGDFVALSLGDNFACGLRANGRAECWGAMNPQQVPTENGFIAITAGAMHACGLHPDGSVRCWGENWAGQATPPAELFTAIGAGVSHTCGLRPDGHVQCWGENWANQSTPPSQDRFIALSVGAFHNCGVRIDGTVACWGDVRWNVNYEPGPPPPGPPYMPWEGVFSMGQLAAGDHHHCQITPDGRLSCFGGFNPDPAPGKHFSAASSGFDATCARNELGSLQCFGNNDMVRENLPAEPLRQFDLGYEHACGVLALDGRAQCWGRETNGKTIAPQGLFRGLSAGLMHSCGVRFDGHGECWGYNGDGQTNVPMLPPLPPLPPMSERGFLSIQAGERNSCSLDSDLHIRCWGMGPSLPFDPTQPGELPEFATFRALSVGTNHSCAIRTNGRLLCWGANWSGQLQNVPEGTFVAVSAGNFHTCAIRTDGRRECWGEPWMTPRLVLDPDNLRGIRPGEYLNVQFQLRSESPYPVQNPTYSIVAGSLPWGFFLDPNGILHGTWHETGRYPITVEGRDQNGFAVRRDYVLSIDDTPPLIEPQITGTAGDNGWYVSPVEVSWAVTDPESEIRFKYGCDPVQVQWETPDAGFFCHAESAGGLTHKEVHVKVDQLPPHVSVRSFTANGALATIEFDGFDPLSGLAGFECSIDGGAFAACASPLQRTFAPGVHEMLIRAVDAAGNRSAPTYKNWFTDATPPQVFATATGQQGLNGWYTGNVQIQWQVRDDETPVMSMVGCEPATLSSDALGATFTCTATSQGGSTTQQITVRRDATAPDTRLIAKPAAVINATSATFEFDGSDGTSGVVAYECRFDSSYQWQPCTSPKRYDNLAHGRHSFYVRAIDAAGNRDELEAGYPFTVDTTPPQIIAGQSANWGSNGWAIGDVQVSFAIYEPESTYTQTPECDARTVNADTTGTQITCSATSIAGTSTNTITVRRDTVAPDTHFTATPDNGSSGSASFVFAGDDATSGIASYECSLDGAAYVACASSFTADVASGTHTFSVRAVDQAGLRDASPASHVWTVDATGPTVTPSVTGTLGNNGWYVGDVQISWQVADPDSSVSSTGCNTVQLTSDTSGATFTCTATSVGGTTVRSVTVKRDTTAPVITAAATTAPNAAGWYKSDVAVGYSCSDAASGVVACPAAQVLGGEGNAIASAPRSVTDAAGNSATSNVVTVKIDRTAPTLAPVVTPGTLLLNANTSALPNANDALSGLSTKDCAMLATASVGNKTVSCTATDLAGNTATAAAAYRVVYGFQGFNTPVQNPSVLNVLKAGRSVSLRWRVVDAQGAPVSNLTMANVGSTVIGCPVATENRIYTYGGSNAQLQNLGNGYYQLDWMAAASLRNQCRRLDLYIGDGEPRPALFKFN